MEIKVGTLVVAKLASGNKRLGIVYEKLGIQDQITEETVWWVVCHPNGTHQPIDETDLKAIAYLDEEELKLLRKDKISPAQALLAHLQDIIVLLF